MTIQELWRLERSTPRVEPVRDVDHETGGASPWKTYRRFPRRCTDCGSRSIVRDGRYRCRECAARLTRDAA